MLRKQNQRIIKMLFVRDLWRSSGPASHSEQEDHQRAASFLMHTFDEANSELPPKKGLSRDIWSIGWVATAHGGIRSAPLCKFSKASQKSRKPDEGPLSSAWGAHRLQCSFLSKGIGHSPYVNKSSIVPKSGILNYFGHF